MTSFYINTLSKSLKSTFKPLDILHTTGRSIAGNASSSSSGINDANSPLHGIRVLDLSRIVAGPYCSMILGDLGAEIIKIERPHVGDEARNWGPAFRNNNKHIQCYFASVNRNKMSVCVDIKSDKGRELIYQLATKSDVLIENYVPGKLDQLKLGYDHLKEIAPHLIYCSVSGNGPAGPYRTKPGYDVIAASMGGLLHITGTEDGEPTKVGVAMTDLSTGLYAHGAILAALFKRTRTGKGQKIDCDLFSTQVACLINIASNYLNAGREAKRWGTAHESIVPYQAFPTKDGYITIGAASDAQFKDFCRRIERPDLAGHERYKTNKLRVNHRDELLLILRSIIVTKTNKEWLEVFEGSQFPCGPVNTIEQVFNDPHIKTIGLVKTLEHEDNAVGDVKVVGPPVVYSEGGNFVRLPPPTLGQHTDKVLSKVLQLSEKDLHDLREQNVIQ